MQSLKLITEMKVFTNILKQYWGYSKFRPLQLEIIESVALHNKDTLGLMPTGGGKSITFQVSGLYKEGICIIITPLIALMKDQVDALVKKNIKAIAIYSGMNYREIQTAYENCIYGGVKFLYISPERLKTELFRAKIMQMNVSLITVDEAHCISQWGYDFRPSYLEIAAIRELIPHVPILALTATATPEVVTDIQNKLQFKEHHLLQKSFERKNLTYIVKQKEDKLGYILSICKKIRGAGIVYVKTRKQTKQIAQALRELGMNADYYHAGLDAPTRSLKQEQWTKSKNMVMVSTNAFGMGIDKPNVRFVLHFDIPESIEAYFQEAGRAGRDELESFAVLLYNKRDITTLKTNFAKKYPDLRYIKQTYQMLADYYQLATGAAKGAVFDFYIEDFCKKFNADIVKTYNSIKLLEQEGYIVLTDADETKSRAKFTIERNDLYKFQVENRQFDGFVKLLLRTYSGIFSEYAYISEEFLAKKAQVKPELIFQYLIALSKLGILSYYRAKQNPLLVFTEERLPPDLLHFNTERIEELKNKDKQRIEAIIQYALTSTKCRSNQLLEYFGEQVAVRCGNCDVCRKRNELKVNKLSFDYIADDLKKLIGDNAMSLHDIIEAINHEQEDVTKVIQFLLEHKKISYTGSGLLMWNK